ncbi:MAG: flap endonuclease-1 [Candidatus Brockarchaeota archaeon]|nr:flap endonuclease-1 [Candidatus Brockarchaeota archaeon]
MGVQLGEIVPRQEVSLESLRGLSVAIDAFNALYQFLSIIRGHDGTPLKNRKGEVTSHLSGIFFRCCNLLKFGVRPVFVLDGEPPRLKKAEISRRRASRAEARAKYEEALARGEAEEARKFAQASTTLEEYMVETSVRLLDAMGIPVVQAPSEGEAQAAHMAKSEVVWAAASQDYDSLLFGAPRLVRNVAITGRRKLPNKPSYVEVKPELVVLEEVLKQNGISQDQLVTIGLLVGTDFTPGVRGLGPKTALKLVKQGKTVDEIYRERGLEKPPELDDARDFFTKPKVLEDVDLEWRAMDVEAVVKYLRDEHDFSEERVRKAAEEVATAQRGMKGSLSKWL